MRAEGLAVTLLDVDVDRVDPGAVPPAATVSTVPPPPTSGVQVAASADDAARYERRATLGEGGMGEVLLCIDRRVGREVAMKVARASAEGGPARFLEEAQLQAVLEHPSIVPVYDIGVDALGEPFFTMKRVRGDTLAEVLARATAERPPLHRLLSAFCQVCLTVDYAHARGVLHRDLKPSNVMLGDFGEVYVLDWGLARRRAREDRAAGGTLGYMAPEQLDPRRGAIGPASDVYALGSILFEILAGTPLHDTSSCLAAIRSTLEAAAPIPSQRSPAQSTPPELDAVCARATARSPEHRYASARELHDAVARFVEGDRDVTRRRALAAEHAERASALADRVLATERSGEGAGARDDARATALRDAGRALALDPENERASETVLRLLTAPPRELPADVDRAMRAYVSRYRAAGLRLGAYAMLSSPLYIAAFAAMGIRQPVVAGAITALFLAAALRALAAARRSVELTKPPYTWLAIHAAIAVSLSLAFGPFLVVPLIATVQMQAFLFLHQDRARRARVVAATCLSILLPLLLEIAGVLAPSCRVDHGTLVFLPRLVAFAPGLTIPLLAFMNVAIVATSGAWSIHVRELLTEAERRAHLQTWQLQKLTGDWIARPR